ncbi:hypothetical protein CKM354_001238200 [Cercospora kikuchii]|uniref:Uncharacterized protein n=1 Tax=Cercospora kikuchii TaxID=84275 RepID=A0A9P3FLW4_9PEZI|nr:uncharacterized protein CKM354_001238200 [Cercospora kikuchii]GIZ49352.1 hypothetical protein CKM354_001238200 [Cercospora kikuchii]
MALDLSFLKSNTMELVILRKEKSEDEETFCVDVCYSMQHSGKAVVLKHKSPGLGEVFTSFTLTAGGFELSADIDNEGYNAQYAAFTPVNFADKNDFVVLARIQDLINPAHESNSNALQSHEYYSHLALIKDFHKN